MRFVLTSRADEQLTALLYDIAVLAGWDHSMDEEEKLYAAFAAIARNPGIGHRRTDLTALPILFYFSRPYMILYQRESVPLRIVAIRHGSRDFAPLFEELDS